MMENNHGDPPAAAQPAKPLNYADLKYTVPSDGPTGTCAICFRNFVPGQQVYRDNAPDSFRCLSHGLASSPSHQTILEQFDFSVAGVHLLDSPRPNYDNYDKAEWHTRGIKQGLTIARVILEEVLKAQAVAPAAALSPTSDEVYCDVCQKPVAEIRCAQCGPTDVMLFMVLEGLMERWRTAAEGCRSLSRCESVEYYKAAYNAAAVNRDECARELGVVLVDAKSVQKSAALSPSEEPKK